jgi:hypothetical protein
MRTIWALAGLLAAALAGAAAWYLTRPPVLTEDELAARYAVPLSPPDGAQKVYHLGHSLVNRNMPAMLEQMAHAAGFGGHGHRSQLGWGTSMDEHRRGEINGFDVENATAAYRPAAEAMASGDYDVVVLTESVEIRDAVRHDDSARALRHWVAAARAGNPGVRVYLYETWHRLDDPEGWLERIDADLARHWKGDLLRPAMAQADVGTVYVIPAGQVLAAAVRAAESGALPGLTSRQDFMARTPDGSVDTIHLNDLGNWLVAMVHFAVIYHRSPQGLPHRLVLPDGSAATPAPDTAVAALQKLVWDTVRRYPESGLAAP